MRSPSEVPPFKSDSILLPVVGHEAQHQENQHHGKYGGGQHLLQLREQNADQLNSRGPDAYDEHRGKHEQHEHGDHFDGRFCGLFFGALAALGAQRIGVNAERLGNAGTEAVGLHQHRNQGPNVVNARAVGQVAQSFGAGLSGSHLQVHQAEFFAEFFVRVLQIFTDALHGLIERQSGFDADDSQVEGIGQCQPDFQLTFSDDALEDEPRQNESARRYRDQHHGVVQANLSDDHQPQAAQRHQGANAVVVGDVPLLAIARLHQHDTSARNIIR